jgi:hypothetical protein
MRANKEHVLVYSYKHINEKLLIEDRKNFSSEEDMLEYAKNIRRYLNKDCVLVKKPMIIC